MMVVARSSGLTLLLIIAVLRLPDDCGADILLPSTTTTTRGEECALAEARCSPNAAQRVASGSITPLAAVLEILAAKEPNEGFLTVWATTRDAGNFDACADETLMGEASRWCLVVPSPGGPQYGACVPRACDASSLDMSIACRLGQDPTTAKQVAKLEALLGALNLTAAADGVAKATAALKAGAGLYDSKKTYCVDSKPPNPPNAGAWWMLALFVALASIVALATVADISSPKERLQNAFSARVSLAKLFEVNSRAPRLVALDGLRSLSTGYIVLGHSVLFTVLGGHASNSSTWTIDYLKSRDATIVSGAFFAVDSFFWLSGFLAVLALLKATAAGKLAKTLSLSLVARYLRLAPMVALLLLVHLYVEPLLYQGGPFAKKIENDKCNSAWWKVLLFVNNVTPTAAARDLDCVGWLWYLMNDFQFFAVSAIPAVFLLRWQTRGLAVGYLGAQIVAGCAVSAYLSHKYSMPLYIATKQQLYLRPWCRVMPFAVGALHAIYIDRSVGAANILSSVKKQDDAPRRERRDLAVQFCGLGGLIFLVMAPDSSIRQGELLSTTKTGYLGTWPQPARDLWVACSRLAWGVALSLAMHPTFREEAAPASWCGRLLLLTRSFLGHGSWQVLAKLSYGTYIFHIVVVSVLFQRQRAFVAWDRLLIMQFVLTVFTLATSLSFAAFLFFERPLASLLGVALRRASSPRQPKNALDLEGSSADAAADAEGSAGPPPNLSQPLLPQDNN